MSTEEARRAYANAHYMFWMPCPRCGNYFGGHEWLSTIICRRDPTQGHGACCPQISELDDARACARGHDRDTIVEMLAQLLGVSVAEAEKSLAHILAREPATHSSRLHMLAVEAGLSESEERRADFAYGNCVIENPAVTEEMAIEAVIRSRYVCK